MAKIQPLEPMIAGEVGVVEAAPPEPNKRAKTKLEIRVFTFTMNKITNISTPCNDSGSVSTEISRAISR